tara:strand:- start:3366 stop:5486 length:2121 start_codon:yes stop_codon:yes gene_type:complete
MLKIVKNKILIIFASFIGISCLLIMPDYQVPEVEIVSPLAGEYVAEIVPIICEISDNSNLLRAELWVNNDSTGIQIPYYDEMGNTIESFEEIKESYRMQWNTRWVEDNSYYLHVRAYDINGNMGKSDEVLIAVNNENSNPASISITSIELENRNYRISWEKSEDEDFKKYTLQHLNPWIDFFHYNEIEILTTTEQDCTSFLHVGIDPTIINNYYRIKVYDELDFVSTSLPKVILPDPYPIALDIVSASYDNNSIIINWNKCLETDFLRYELYESYDEDMENSELICSIDDAEILEFIREGIYDNETRYYRIDVIDIWEQKTKGTILEANAFTRFYKAYGGIEDDGGFHVIPISQNGFIVSGYTKSFGAGDKDGLVLQLDLEGNQLSKNTFGSSNLDVIEDAVILSDSTIIFAGRTESNQNNGIDGWIIHTDRMGNFISDNSFGNLGNDRLNAISNNNGSLIAVGSKSIQNGNSTDIDIWLVKLDQFGTIINEYTFGGSNFDYGKDVYPLSVGGYILLGETLSYGSGGFDIYLLKISEFGDIEWSTTLSGTTSNESSKKLIFDKSGGGYYILMKEGGNSSAPVCIIKVDINGNELWRHNYGYTVNDNGADMIDIGINSDILLVFGTTYINGNGDLWFFKVDINTGEMFDENIFSDGENEDYGYGINVVTDDGGYILVGETTSYGSGGKDVIVIKTDPYGNTVGFEIE